MKDRMSRLVVHTSLGSHNLLVRRAEETHPQQPGWRSSCHPCVIRSALRFIVPPPQLPTTNRHLIVLPRNFCFPLLNGLLFLTWRLCDLPDRPAHSLPSPAPFENPPRRDAQQQRGTKAGDETRARELSVIRLARVMTTPWWLNGCSRESSQS